MTTTSDTRTFASIYTDKELRREARAAVLAYGKEHGPGRRVRFLGFSVRIEGLDGQGRAALIGYGAWSSSTGPIDFRVTVAI